MADSFRAKHNRRSATALFEQIKAEGDYGGLQPAHRLHTCVARRAGKSLGAFVPPTFALGEAFQFD